MMTDTTGGGPAMESVATISVASMSRIHYYSWVRDIFCFRRSRRFSGALAPILILTLLMLAGCYSGSRPPRIGAAAPDFTVHDSDHTVTLSQFKGQVVVLNFWATWCPPCVEEMPSLVQMQQRMKSKGVTVIAVSLDVDESN